MGQEQLINFAGPEEFSEAEKFRYSLVENQIHGTIETIFTNGAAVSYDGSSVYYGIRRDDIPQRFLSAYDAFQTFKCLPQELGIPVKPYESTSRLHVFPPNLHKLLAYTYSKRGSIGIDVVSGIDNNGKPASYNLERTGDMQALTHVARLKVLNQGLDPVVCKPRKIVNEALKKLSERSIDGGLGEYSQAIKKMLKEQAEMVNGVEEYLNGQK